MKILVTGAKGFVGRNLVETLKTIRDGKCKKYRFLNDVDIFECDIDTLDEELDKYVKCCDFVINLAGVNRPQNVEEFMQGNFGFTTILLDKLKSAKNKCPILMSSSIQACLDNDYGKSKKAGEDYLIQYGKDNGVKTYIYRLPNVFGKWCRPNYNSAVATFCNNIANGLPITINNRDTQLTLVYIDDVVDSFIKTINNEVVYDGEYCKVATEHKATLGDITDKLYNFKASRNSLDIANMSDPFEKKLYSTYLSYLSVNDFAYDLVSHCDNRGSFTEFIHTLNNGQVSVNVSKPHIIKGQHWHHTKCEKFLVVSGNGVIRFRKIGDDKVTEYFVSGYKLQVVDIPTGYTHNIENLGDSDMVTIMWCNEVFDPENPDTYFEEV
ncbi:polysaccharide biosynthesis C-terminal domain-containing protein [Thomasclavelia cocleata]|uniref:polysaccharide biosynthesis C-terminal domain-containing protein n=1 Tax=Thomasclavelia cocleata TaxID=69824 RepID=UPI00255B19DB|nr:NAD-dependent epimerase/dehydratase family protein [Thomasclavelia cocleata]